MTEIINEIKLIKHALNKALETGEFEDVTHNSIYQLGSIINKLNEKGQK